MCTRVREQTLQHARQGRTLDYSPIEWQQLMLVSFVQAVVAQGRRQINICRGATTTSCSGYLINSQ